MQRRPVTRLVIANSDPDQEWAGLAHNTAPPPIAVQLPPTAAAVTAPGPLPRHLLHDTSPHASPLRTSAQAGGGGSQPVASLRTYVARRQQQRAASSSLHGLSSSSMHDRNGSKEVQATEAAGTATRGSGARGRHGERRQRRAAGSGSTGAGRRGNMADTPDEDMERVGGAAVRRSSTRRRRQSGSLARGLVTTPH